MGFFLVFRAVNEGDEAALAESGKGSSVKVSIRSSQGIAYCPWCGANLRRFYKSRDDLPFVSPRLVT